MSVPIQYQNPVAVYELPDIRNLQIEYNGQTCEASSEKKNPGYVCGDVFLKVHGLDRNYLLVPSGQFVTQIKFFKSNYQGQKELVSVLEKELLSSITSDFVDVRRAVDCR